MKLLLAIALLRTPDEILFAKCNGWVMNWWCEAVNMPRIAGEAWWR
jgi:hypothetical protein